MPKIAASARPEITVNPRSQKAQGRAERIWGFALAGLSAVRIGWASLKTLTTRTLLGAGGNWPSRRAGLELELDRGWFAPAYEAMGFSPAGLLRDIGWITGY